MSADKPTLAEQIDACEIVGHRYYEPTGARLRAAAATLRELLSAAPTAPATQDEPLTPTEIRMAGQRAGMMKAASLIESHLILGAHVVTRLASIIRENANRGVCKCGAGDNAPSSDHDLYCQLAVPEIGENAAQNLSPDREASRTEKSDTVDCGATGVTGRRDGHSALRATPGQRGLTTFDPHPETASAPADLVAEINALLEAPVTLTDENIPIRNLWRRARDRIVVIEAQNEYAVERIAALEAELADALAAIAQHNHECESACGIGDQEGVRCKYRPYFPRHCPECPRDWIIDESAIAELAAANAARAQPGAGEANV